MLNAIYAEFENKPIMLNVVILNVMTPVNQMPIFNNLTYSHFPCPTKLVSTSVNCADVGVNYAERFIALDRGATTTILFTAVIVTVSL